MRSDCIIPGCDRNSRTTIDCKRVRSEYISVFKFPSQYNPLFSDWLDVIPDKENIRPGLYNGVCYKHFLDTDITYTPTKKRKLRDTAVPCIFDGVPITRIDPEHSFRDQSCSSDRVRIESISSDSAFRFLFKITYIFYILIVIRKTQ